MKKYVWLFFALVIGLYMTSRVWEKDQKIAEALESAKKAAQDVTATAERAIYVNANAHETTDLQRQDESLPDVLVENSDMNPQDAPPLAKASNKMIEAVRKAKALAALSQSTPPSPGQEYTKTLPADKATLDQASSQTLDGEVLVENSTVSPTLRPLADGVQAITTDEIKFEWGKAQIESESLPTLKSVADLVKQLGKINRIRIEGYTDDTGDPAFNVFLSEQRAKAVAQYLTEVGIPQDKVEYEGFGAEQPIADNKTPQGRASNRRVEFKVIK